MLVMGKGTQNARVIGSLLPNDKGSHPWKQISNAKRKLKLYVTWPHSTIPYTVHKCSIYLIRIHLTMLTTMRMHAFGIAGARL